MFVGSARVTHPQAVNRPDGVIHGIERFEIPESVQQDFNSRRSLWEIDPRTKRLKKLSKSRSQTSASAPSPTRFARTASSTRSTAHRLTLPPRFSIGRATRPPRSTSEHHVHVQEDLQGRISVPEMVLAVSHSAPYLSSQYEPGDPDYDPGDHGEQEEGRVAETGELERVRHYLVLARVRSLWVVRGRRGGGKLTLSLVVVEVKKKGGDKGDYEDFCNRELRPGLQNLMLEEGTSSFPPPSPALDKGNNCLALWECGGLVSMGNNNTTIVTIYTKSHMLPPSSHFLKVTHTRSLACTISRTLPPLPPSCLWLSPQETKNGNALQKLRISRAGIEGVSR
ncbi:hypothetical protein FH972_014383 [Carpinus fangiana]|uniref:Uncharacterized protein n=1 Tax=Carpinus fangiana TaxID=176857 RepID=A0A5N6R9Y5_9ROSI|nr:hypothetical protein FH972_014383 [Carpinus fangiana]